MAVLDKRIEVDARPEQVFAVLGHVERWPTWMPSALRVARVTEREGPGMLIRSESAACGTRLSWDAVAEEWLPGRKVSWRQVQGDWRKARIAWELSPGRRGTVVRLHAELDLPHVLDVELTTEAADQELSASFDDALLNLKDLLEA
jgi:uncharacterized membrane protein